MTRQLPGLLLTLGLTACASLPTDLPPRPALSAPATAATLAALSKAAPSAAAPLQERWWTSFGQPDLDRLIETALRDQPGLAAARARLRAAQQAERLAHLETQVHYATDASVLREHLSKNGLFPPPIGGSTFTQTDISENLSYNLDWWDRNRALLRAAGNQRQAAQDEAAAVRLDVAAAVADTYFAAADVDAVLALARALAQVHRRQHDLLKARFDLGLDAAQPLLDARRRLDLDDDVIKGLEYRASALRYRLSALTGSDPDHAQALPVPSLKVHVPALPGRLPLDWLARRPDVAALRSRVSAAAALSDAARADFYPNLDLRLMVGLETLELGKLLQGGSLSASLGPALHLPLFNTQTLRAKLGMREADYAASVAAYNRTVQEDARQAADAYALNSTLEQRSRAQGQALQELEQTRDLAQRRRDLGLAGALAALEADDAVLGQRIQNSEIQAARLRARVALFKALGGNPTDEDQTP
jgi:NodT family efflux transporter outer membrane factor (OMF) lipoprotein